MDKVQPNTEEEKVRCLFGIARKEASWIISNFCNILEDDKVGYGHLAVMLQSESKSTCKYK